jgi:hypothetical protein
VANSAFRGGAQKDLERIAIFELETSLHEFSVMPFQNLQHILKETNQQEEISEVSLTRSPSRFVGVLRLLPRLRSTRFHD